MILFGSFTSFLPSHLDLFLMRIFHNPSFRIQCLLQLIIFQFFHDDRLLSLDMWPPVLRQCYIHSMYSTKSFIQFHYYLFHSTLLQTVMFVKYIGNLFSVSAFSFISIILPGIGYYATTASNLYYGVVKARIFLSLIVSEWGTLLSVLQAFWTWSCYLTWHFF